MSELNRRDFVAIGFCASGALVIGCKPRRPGAGVKDDGEPENADQTEAGALDGATAGTFEQWIGIAADQDVVSVFVDRVEMGQGTQTMFASIVAEELRIDSANFSRMVRPVNAANDLRFRNPQFLLQVTGFSSSTTTCWGPLEKTALFASGLLADGPLSSTLADGQAAVAQAFGNDLYNNRLRQAAATLREAFATVGKGECKNLRVGATSFKDLLRTQRPAIEAAFRAIRARGATVTEPSAQSLIVGKNNVGRPDIRAKIRGEAIYGMDAGIDPSNPGIKFARVRRSDFVQGMCVNPDEAFLANANKDPQVNVFAIGVDKDKKKCRGVAVVASSWWQAYQISFGLPPLGIFAQTYIKELDDRKVSEDLRKLEGSQIATDVGQNRGTPRTNIDGCVTKRFEVPFVPHSAMEPLNCTVKITGSRCELWLGTQAQEGAVEIARQITGLTDIVLHPVEIGGSFGRRLSADFVAEAVEIANHPSVKGQMVKLIWSRDDDFRYDYYRPAALNVITGRVTPAGDQITDWDHQTISQSITTYLASELALSIYNGATSAAITNATGKIFSTALTRFVKDPFTGEGGRREDLAYNTDRFRLTQVPYRKGRGLEQVPIGYWRSVAHSHTAFAVESMIDVLAGDKDPLEFRMGLYRTSQHVDRLRCIAIAQTLQQYEQRVASEVKGLTRGVAIHRSFGSIVGYMVFLELLDDEIRVRHVGAAVDCGIGINIDVITQQVEGGFIFGLSQALKQKITFRNGFVQEFTFLQCDVARMRDAPKFQVFLMPSNQKPSGIGEPVVPPAAPAIANAVARLPGVGRPLSLPIRIKNGKLVT